MDWQAAIKDAWDEDWVRYLLLPGLIALMLAIWGWRAEKRRKERSDPDAVPLLPWRDISFWSSFAALFLLGAALKVWLAS
ncbi:MAG: hypothetical protein ACKOQM_11190 [Novosphingobium sp.]